LKSSFEDAKREQLFCGCFSKHSIDQTGKPLVIQQGEAKVPFGINYSRNADVLGTNITEVTRQVEKKQAGLRLKCELEPSVEYQGDEICSGKSCLSEAYRGVSAEMCCQVCWNTAGCEYFTHKHVYGKVGHEHRYPGYDECILSGPKVRKVANYSAPVVSGKLSFLE